MAGGHDRRFLLVTSYYTGLKRSVETGQFEATGMPAVAELWKGLDRAGIPFDHILLNIAGSTDRVEEKEIREFHARFTVAEWAVDGRVGKARAMLARLRFVARTARRFPYDLVYVDRAHLLEGALLTLMQDAPVVLRLHGTATLPETLRAPGVNPVRWLRRLAIQARFGAIVGSEDGTPVRQFLDRYCHPGVPRRIWVHGMPGGPDDSDAPEENQRTILFVGRLARYKGGHLFVDAIRELSSRRSDFEALVVGAGPREKNLRERAETIPEIRFTGEISHERVQRLQRSAAVFVSVNDLANLTNTVIEALAAGSCIVAFGHDPETGRDASTQRLLDGAVRFVDRSIAPEELATVLEELLDDRSLRKEYERRAREVADRHLRTWVERIDDEIALLERLAADEEIPTESERRCRRSSPPEHLE